ncbi:MAG TPA: hypothetical protein VM243_20635 [Phycisphaerae bacterium]|nr:hypothetical protein [Phycisphaerae bacterium]
MTESTTIDDLQQYQLVILRRLRSGPLTEFELAAEVAGHSGYTPAQSAERIVGWLEELQSSGFIWTGRLFNAAGQFIYAAALTRLGKELVG